jgi:hypothetical protein
MNEHYQKWDELAPRGLLLIGLGISITGQAIIAKAKGRGFFKWFLKGLLGLILINSGVAVFGESVKHRVLYELDIQKLRES